MKLLFLLLLPLASFSQFEMTKDKVSGTIVYQIDSFSADKIYNKVLAYIQANYKNPERVQKAQIPNEMVRMEFTTESPTAATKGFSISRENLELYCLFIIEIKEGKMRVTCEGKQYAKSSTFGEITYDFDFVFNKDGTVKEKRLNYKKEVEHLYSATAENFYKYITAKASEW